MKLFYFLLLATLIVNSILAEDFTTLRTKTEDEEEVRASKRFLLRMAEKKRHAKEESNLASKVKNATKHNPAKRQHQLGKNTTKKKKVGTETHFNKGPNSYSSDYSSSENYESSDNHYESSDNHYESSEYESSENGYESSEYESSGEGYYDSNYESSGEGYYDSDYESSEYESDGGYSSTESYSASDEYSSENYEDLWSKVKCQKISATGSQPNGEFFGKPNGSYRQCWDMVAPPNYFFELSVTMYQPSSYAPWICSEEDFLKGTDVVSIRNVAPPKNLWEESPGNLMMVICFKGEYHSLWTQANSAHIRLSEVFSSKGNGFSIKYKMKSCNDYQWYCHGQTPFPTTSRPPINFPTQRPTPAVATARPTSQNCESLPSGNKGVIEVKEEDYENDVSQCWNVKDPKTSDASLMTLKLTLDGVEKLNDNSCGDAINLYAVYDYKEGRTPKVVKNLVAGPICGEMGIFHYKVSKNILVSGGFPGTLSYIHVDFKTDRQVTSEGWSLMYNFGGEFDEDRHVVTDFAGLIAATVRAKDHIPTYIDIDADTIYFNDTWSFLIPRKKHILLNPHPPRTSVVFDGSQKVKQAYTPPEVELEEPPASIVKVRGTLEMNRIHFRFFRLPNLLVTDGIGLVHVDDGGNITRIEDCRFSSNDARPIYEKEYQDVTKTRVFPKGAVLQIEKGGKVSEIKNTEFSYNQHTIIGNRGFLGTVHGCSFVNNRVGEGIDYDDGSRVAVYGAIIANSDSLKGVSSCSFHRNTANMSLYEQGRRNVNETFEFFLDPHQSDL